MASSPLLIKQVKKPAVETKVDEKIILEALNNPLPTLRTITKESLYHFIQYFWDTYSLDPLVLNWHMEVLCGELEKVAKRVAERKDNDYDLIFNQPPGTTKTAIVSIFFPVWCWVNWPWMRFITTSHSSTLSLESAEYSRDIIKSEKFQELFPDIDIKTDKDTKSNFRIVIKRYDHAGRLPKITNGGGRVSTSVGSKIIGFHAHIIIWDDLINPKATYSEAAIFEANTYLDQELSQRKTDKRTSTTIGVMQRLGENDPTQHLIDKLGKQIRLISLPGEIINYRDQLKPAYLARFYVHGLFDPVRMPWSVLKKMETQLGQYGYAAQVGQKPTKPEGGMFKIAKFRVVTTMPPAVSIVRSLRYWDKAGTDEKELKKGQDACYTVGTLMHLLSNGTFLISDVVRGRWGALEREKIIKKTAIADGTDVEVWVEQEPGSGGKESAEATKRNLAGWMAFSECPVGDKVRRADPYSVQVNDGNVSILQGEWNKEFLKEYESFPFSKYKDTVDSGSGAFNKLADNKTVKVY